MCNTTAGVPSPQICKLHNRLVLSLGDSSAGTEPQISNYTDFKSRGVRALTASLHGRLIVDCLAQTILGLLTESQGYVWLLQQAPIWSLIRAFTNMER
jgi:hypothetical protein